MCGCLYDEDEAIDVLIGWSDGTWDTSEWNADDHELAALVDSHASDLSSGKLHLPLESLTLPLELRHRDALTLLAEAGLEDSDHQTLALAWESLTSAINAAGRLQLTRSMIVPIVNRTRVLAEHSHVRWPSPLVPNLATILVAANQLEILDAKSDPLESLLQPLRCHFGLGDGTAASTPCQCFVDYDPFQPAGTVWLRVHSGELVLALSPNLVQPTPTGNTPLNLFTKSHNHSFTETGVATFPLVLLGQIEPTTSSPLLWVYGPPNVPGPRRSLALDSNGVPYQAQLDKRFRSNHRWEEVPLWQAASRLEVYPKRDRSQI